MYTIDPLSGYVVAVIDGVSILFEDLDAYYDYIDSDPQKQGGLYRPPVTSCFYSIAQQHSFVKYENY